MASRIITKKGSGAPLASDLVHGELAVDTVNKRLYTENAGGTIIELGTAPSTIDINAGTIDGTVIGGSSAAAGTFTSITGTSANINGTVTADGLKVETSTTSAITISEDTGSGTAELRFVATDSFPKTKIVTDVSAGSLTLETLASDRLSIANNGDISFYEDTGTTAKFFWDASAESLGIGTASPATLNHISAGYAAPTGGIDSNIKLLVSNSSSGANYVGFGLLSGNNGGSFIHFGDTDDMDVGAIAYFHDNNRMEFTVNGSEAMRIDSAGNVGIGTSSPVAIGGYSSLTMNNTTGTFVEFQEAGTNRLRIGGDNGSAFINGSSGTLRLLTSDVERMRIDSSGYLLIGTTAFFGNGISISKPDVSGVYSTNSGTASTFHYRFANGNGAVGSIVTNGSTTTYNITSDQRLKDNIVDAPSSSDDIDAIQVRSFDWKADGSHQKYGMIAQELMTVAPEAVSGDPESDEMMGVDYSKLVPMLIKEIQSLRARVAQLETN